MTRPIVSVAAMMLYEQGKFQLDEPVSKYLPAFKDTRVLVNGMEVEQETLEDMVAALGEIPLLYQPGTRWVYSVSVDVLGRLIEVIADQPLDRCLDENLFTPIGMNDTFFQVPEGKVDRFGTNHERDRETGELTVVDCPRDWVRVCQRDSGSGLARQATSLSAWASVWRRNIPERVLARKGNIIGVVPPYQAIVD